MPAEIDLPSLHERAEHLAGLAHYGQRDKAGKPYVEHVQRVAAYAVEMIPEFEDWTHQVLDPIRAVTTCLLHDTIEDTWVTDKILRGLFPGSIVNDVLTLTFQHTPIQTVERGGRAATHVERRSAKARDQDRYLHQIRGSRSPYVRLGKLADLRDNTDPARMRALTEKEQQYFAGKYIWYAHATGLLDSPFADIFVHLDGYLPTSRGEYLAMRRGEVGSTANRDGWTHLHHDGGVWAHPHGEKCSEGLAR